MLKNLPVNERDTRDEVLIPGSGRFPGVGNVNPLQYSCLDNSTERSLAGYSPRGYKESDMTGRTTMRLWYGSQMRGINRLVRVCIIRRI